MRLPWSLGQISTRPLIHTATQLYVVPRSMPMHGPSILLSFFPSFDAPPRTPSSNLQAHVHACRGSP